ncbi:MAG: nuclear transport factor 2 family protein [Ilumatobacteraceae bacterium]|nr:nuclear transport factor 2 family protein [Acidimicrobiales bacterium]MCB9394847.1 nuclear transport factor 2 family protein [Acidimicrobiaceae bacterium]
MYHTIVRSKVRGVFHALSAGDAGPMLDTLAPTFRYEFAGDHSLGGTRTRRSDMEAWWQRVFRLFPDARFEVREVMVDGPPWATRIATRVQISAATTTGRYDNVFVQTMAMRWGRVVEVFTLEDTSRLERELERQSAEGVAEASAAPIVSS